jgi:hypothetical protein
MIFIGGTRGMRKEGQAGDDPKGLFSKVRAAFVPDPAFQGFTSQGKGAILCKGKTGRNSSCVGASQRCGSGTPLKPHSLYRVFPL